MVAEQNDIISARRQDMIGAAMYIFDKECSSGDHVPNASPCSLCKRFIINAGIEKVIIRDSKTIYRDTYVDQWIENDDSLERNGCY